MYSVQCDNAANCAKYILQGRGYANPPLESSRQSAEQNTRRNHTSSSGSSMEEPAVVSHPTEDAGRLPNPAPTHRGSNHTNTPRGCASRLPQLATWLISGNVSKTKKFRRRAQSCCSYHGDRSQPNPMTHYSGSGLTGVINSIQIPFQDL